MFIFLSHCLFHSFFFFLLQCIKVSPAGQAVPRTTHHASVVRLPISANESFPVFPALLNAVHRGVTVRLIINDYNTKTCSGQIAPLDYLFLNKVDVRYYASTTFMHAKYMMIDKGKKTSISSVNFR